MKTLKKKKPELMCPIRDWASLEACKEYADAVYFSVSALSMRQNANNLTLQELGPFVRRCQKYGIKAYLAVNCTLYNNDLKTAEKIIAKAKKENVNAVIVWDSAAIMLAKKNKIPFFISTQANVSNWQSAEFYKKLGAKRVVLAREMTLEQISETKKRLSVEIETFVHGAMCVSISGRCLFSAYLYGKSANCGSCAQPCRKAWALTDDEGNKIISEGKYFLSAKDLCMIEYIPELVRAGIDSFKLEGRRRDPKYISTVSRLYRQAIDEYFAGTYTQAKAREWKRELANVYNRGFSTGFFFGEPSKEGISYDKPDNLSKTKKILLGEVAHYYPKIRVAIISLKHRGCAIGDNIIIEGKKTFLEQKISSMEKENTKIKKAAKGEEVAVRLSGTARKNDLIYRISEKDN